MNKSIQQAFWSFLLVVSFLFATGCAHQSLSPGGMIAPDQRLRPGQGMSSSSKLGGTGEQEQKPPVEENKPKRQQKSAVSKSQPETNTGATEASGGGIRKVAARGAGSGNKAVKNTEENAPFVPLDRIDVASLESNPEVNATGITDKGEGLVLNFDQAPLKEVILSLARLLKIDYMFLAEPQGEVTIHTSGTIAKEELFPLFYQILEANGLTAVREGGIYKIVTMQEAPRYVTSSQIKGEADPIGERQEINIRIIPLKYIGTAEMTKIITPFISSEGSIISHDQSNTLVLVDHPVNIRKALILVKSFDVNVFEDIRHAIYPVENMDSAKLASSLQEMLAFYQQQSKQEIKIINLEKLNSLLILSNSDPLFRKARDFIKELDRPGDGSEPRIFIYFIKNSTAKDMESLLNSIFSKSGDEKKNTESAKPVEEKKKDAAGNPFAQKAEEKKTTITRKTPVSDLGSGTLRGEIKITSDEIRNALIIEALPSDYQIAKKVLERLDILPRQVLISVTLAEVQLDDGLDLGVEWSWTHNSNKNSPNNSTWSALMNGDVGLSYTIGQAKEWSAALSALAQRQKVDILSSPSVLASDNKEARINIATEVPVASAQITYNDDNTDRTQTDIQYRNTGVILNVIPHINENGLVSMEINQEVSEQSDGVQVGGSTYPSFFKRSINTTLTVNNGQTIVIGGLIRETNSDSSNGVPFLSEVPVLGWLFGTVGQGVSKTELIVMIKPTVVASLQDVDAVTSEFARKVGYDYL